MAAPKGNKFAVGSRGGNGHIPQYKPVYAQQVRKACEAGFTDCELADLFGVSEVTINNWKLAHDDFALALRSAKGKADDRVERKLYQKACGFWIDTEKVFCNKDGYVTRVAVREYYPPDTTAIVWWQKNRQPDKWRDKHEVDVSGKMEHRFTLEIFEHQDGSGGKLIEHQSKKQIERVR